MDTGFIIMLESRPNRVFGMTKRGHVEKDAVLDGVTHMDPQQSFFNRMCLILECIKSHERAMSAHALSKHQPLHTFVVALQEN